MLKKKTAERAAPNKVIIQIDELSKKEVLSFIEQVYFYTKTYLEWDYSNYKKIFLHLTIRNMSIA